LPSAAHRGGGQEVRVGLAAPLTGPSAILGQQMKAGAEAAAARRAQR
jgi:ABC-type branched-subunit amino acid transport system substrate-binding protein